MEENSERSRLIRMFELRYQVSLRRKKKTDLSRSILVIAYFLMSPKDWLAMNLSTLGYLLQTFHYNVLA